MTSHTISPSWSRIKSAVRVSSYASTAKAPRVPCPPGTLTCPASYVLVGESSNDAFFSTCHGAGRAMSRHAAMRTGDGVELRRSLQRQGILVETRSVASLPEESPEAYKDVDEVVRACEGAGLSRPVARLRPVGVLKG